MKKINLQTIWLWPNIDAGADLISTEIRRFRETEKSDWLYLIKNFRPEVFQKVLKNTSCAIGNSSSFLRDSTFTGAPIVLVGNRQVGREYGKNLVESSFNLKELEDKINKQIKHGRYTPDKLYGDGEASKKIVDALVQSNPPVQKTINYIFEK